MSHYFTNNSNLDSKESSYKIKINNNEYTFKTDIGVFSKEYLDFGSKILIENIAVKDGDHNILDLGSGYGPIGIFLAKENPKKTIYLIEINDRAVELARENAKINGVSNVIIKQNEILDNISVMFDLVVTNPPIRAGKKTVFDFYEQAFSHLNVGGRLYVVIQKKQGANSTVDKIKELFGNVELVTKVKGYWIIKAIKAK